MSLIDALKECGKISGDSVYVEQLGMDVEIWPLSLSHRLSAGHYEQAFQELGQKFDFGVYFVACSLAENGRLLVDDHKVEDVMSLIQTAPYQVYDKLAPKMDQLSILSHEQEPEKN